MSVAIRTSPGSPHARIMSVAGYRPERIVTNEEICERIDSSDEWIRERSGIVTRHFAAPEETVADMAVAAGAKALAQSGIDPGAIGTVIVATVTHPYPTPAAAPEIAERLGATRAAAFDISAACAGFCHALTIGQDLIRGGTAEYVLIIGVEKLTDWIDPTDRTSAFIFADGAGAAVLGPSDVAAIGPVVWGADGDQRGAITMTQSLIDYRDHGGERFPTLSMQGQSVFRWAVSRIAEASREALDRAGITADDLDAFIPHQANMRITDALVRSLGLPERVVVARDIATTGNTSAASIPIAMDRMLAAGEAPHGGTALVIGFGAGLVYAGQVITLP